MSDIQVLLEQLRLPPDARSNSAFSKILRASGLTLEALAAQVDINFTNSYGRSVIRAEHGTEILLVTLLPRFVPAIHDHNSHSEGANLLVVRGPIFNVNFRSVEGHPSGATLTHSSIRKHNTGDVIFIPGGRNGIHRVVSMAEENEPPAISFNVYWSKDGRSLGDDAFVYDFVKGTRVTTSGPAFFFVDGEDKQDGQRATALIKLEDTVFQHHQLKASEKHGVLTPERAEILTELETQVKGPAFNAVFSQALQQATHFLYRLENERNITDASEYFSGLFARARKMAESLNVDIDRAPPALMNMR